MCLIVIRVKSQNRFEFGFGVGQLVVHEEERAKIVVRLVVVRIQPDGCAKMLGSLGISAQWQQRLAEFGMCASVLWSFSENTLIVGDGVERQLVKLVRHQCRPVFSTARQNLIGELRHFIRGLGTIANLFRGLVRIMDVVRRIIIGEVHYQFGTLRKKYWLGVTIVSLPV